MSDLGQNQNNQDQQVSSFVKEVAKYFMNFLETDFKKRRIPKRNTIQKVQNGLKVAIDLDKYDSLKKFLIGSLNKGFPKEEFSLKKGAYTTNIPSSLIELISKKIDQLKQEDLKDLFQDIEVLVQENLLLFKKEHDKFLEETKEGTKKLVAKRLILPFLDELDKPLENLELADENSKYQLEVDIVDALFSSFEASFHDLLQNYSQDIKSFDIKKELKKSVILSEIKGNLLNFFNNFAVSDAFYDFYQLFRNNKLIDKTELYLYFYEISLGNEKFPVFYLPLSIEKQENNFVLKFDSRIFINTKAIEFVVQEYNLQVKRQATLAGEFERIIYLNEHEDFQGQLESTIKKIENFFELNRNINIQDSAPQKGINLIASLSNKSYFYLFDKSDESLINDYEEILNDKGLLLAKFDELLKSFIEENPKDFTLEIDDEWLEKEIPNKLVFDSPIPLNDEQKQVLMALEKPDCKFLVLEGPPGTGKSHTITAVICKALLEEKSVLVLSDKKEALDVVEDKISQTLNKIRHEDDFQNPILRLGKSGNKFYKIVQGQTIQKIREHYQAYKARKDEYDQIRTEAVNNLKNNIKDNINYFEGISIKDIEYYFQHAENFEKLNWISSENLSDLSTDLPSLKASLGKITKNNKILISLENVSEEGLEKLKDLYDLLIGIKTSKAKLSSKFSYSELKNHNKKWLLDFSKTIGDLLEEIQSLKETSINEEALKFDLNENIQKLQSSVSKYELLRSIYNESDRILGSNVRDKDFLANFVVPKEQSVAESISELKQYCLNLQKLKKPLIGFLLSGNQISDLTRSIKRSLHYFNIENPDKNFQRILEVLNVLEILREKVTSNSLGDEEFRFIFNCLQQDKELNFPISLAKSSKKLIDFCDDYPNYAIKNFEELKEAELAIEVINLINEISNYDPQISFLNTLDVEIDAEKLTTQNLDALIQKIETIIPDFEKVLELFDDIQFVKDFIKKYPKLSDQIKLNSDFNYLRDINSIIEKHPDEEINTYLEYKEIERKLEDQFGIQENGFYSDGVTTIEHLVTAQMTYFLDKRIIEYTSGFAGDVNTLKNILRKKQKFPKELFRNLKKAFPCILAGIRDYAEYIPLEKDLFDLIIIDEASQVSIAQSLPALIRGKQIVVLGDDKQFSNVKANNASKVTNQELKKKVQEAFLLEKGKEESNYGWLTKVQENFDVKNSILKFMRFIRNYECQLKKHFRCYPEIISFSDKYFYADSLQCMKVRGVPIDDVIKFDVIDHDGKLDESKNTNEMEVNYIIKQLKKLHETGTEQSLGIITPHREQVTLLFDKINELQERDWLFGKCKLKIMTFDTCQGEERDHIFYSMVATKEKDRLNWIFPIDLSKLSDEVDGTVKSQRLNVGFSRAKNCMHFILSKQPEEFKGEIKNALLHYKNELEVGRGKTLGQTDPNSPMEDKIKHYFEQTNFYKQNKELIELKPQFPLGDYLQQLDGNYIHPKYKVDFLLMYKDEKIIIEYDGFKEHFSENIYDVDQSNYEYYMNENDIYRQKVLEGYGYKFLRINKFNIGNDPIQTLDERLTNIVKKKSKILKF